SWNAIIKGNGIKTSRRVNLNRERIAAAAMKRISVFGGSKPRPGEPDYEQALRLGSLLGAAGYTVLTGGYIGTMEAVSRGAAEAGGHVVGITCDEIEAWRPVKHNQWVLEEQRHGTLRERLSALIDGCDGALALP